MSIKSVVYVLATTLVKEFMHLITARLTCTVYITLNHKQIIT